MNDKQFFRIVYLASSVSDGRLILNCSAPWATVGSRWDDADVIEQCGVFYYAFDVLSRIKQIE